jgi:cellulose synthase (UDP-forming)
MIRPISGGARNPIWSDIYETAMCFSLAVVTLKACLTPRKERPFEVTPKGQQVSKTASAFVVDVWPHLLTFGLLVGGLALGSIKLWQGTGDPGLAVSLWWGSINLLLLTVTLFVASEQDQVRGQFRIDRDFVATLSIDGHTYAARIINISESGAGLLLERPALFTTPEAQLSLTSSSGGLIRIQGRLLRQVREEAGDTTAGFAFDQIDEATSQALIEKIFGDPENWETAQPPYYSSGLLDSVRSIGRALCAPWGSTTGNLRRIPRIDAEMPCHLRLPVGSVYGVVKDLSYIGLSVVLHTTRTTGLDGWLGLPQVTLKVKAVSVVPGQDTVTVRFHVQGIIRGKEQWRDVHESYWRRAS